MRRPSSRSTSCMGVLTGREPNVLLSHHGQWKRAVRVPWRPSWVSACRHDDCLVVRALHDGRHWRVAGTSLHDQRVRVRRSRRREPLGVVGAVNSSADQQGKREGQRWPCGEQKSPDAHFRYSSPMPLIPGTRAWDLEHAPRLDRTSPIAQPVRQCRVALIASRLRAGPVGPGAWSGPSVLLDR
jgi:hypothetical protein